MDGYQLVERKPTTDEYIKLRQAVGWKILDRNAIEQGLQNSLYGICILAGGEVIASVRVVGDGSTVFYVQDVIVLPEHQRKGVGLVMMEKVMEYISSHAAYGAVVGLMAAKGKEPFYEKFGFWKRPNENVGCGMIQFWGREPYVV